MRTCGSCLRTVRRDDPLEAVQLPSLGMSCVCRSCIALAAGNPAPSPKTYPVGSRIPRSQEPGCDGDMLLCALCRQALFEDELPTAVRVPPNDQGVKPAVYSACRECLEKWRPAVHAKLVGLGLIAASADLSVVAGDMLL